MLFWLRDYGGWAAGGPIQRNPDICNEIVILAYTNRISAMDIYLHLPASAIRILYLAVLVANLLFIVMTTAADLGMKPIHPEIARQFDLKNEGVLAAWHSSTLLLLNCIACLAFACRRQIRRPWRAAWLVVALGFLGLSADETAQIHEKMGTKIDTLGYGAGYVPESNLSFNWLTPAIPMGAALGAGLWVFSRRWTEEFPRSRMLALAGMACWSGVLAAEFVESQLVRYGMSRSVQGAVEEGLELAGSTLFLMALLEALRRCGMIRTQDEIE